MRGGAAGHRSASSPRPEPPAAQARWDTRMSVPRASSGSGHRPRRRSRRTTAGEETGFSLRQILQNGVNGSITYDSEAIVSPVHAASGETPSPESQAEPVTERQHQKVPKCRIRSAHGAMQHEPRQHGGAEPYHGRPGAPGEHGAKSGMRQSECDE